MRTSLIIRALLSGSGLGFLLLSNSLSEETKPAIRPWTEYRTIMWIGGSAYQHPEKLPLFLQRLREMGINTGMVEGDADPQPFIEAKMPYYVENIVNKGLCLKWNSHVRDWNGHVSAWQVERAESAFVRDYSLDDPLWQEWARNAMGLAVRKHASNHPLAYDIRDEISTTISANPFDYDFSPSALRGFRDWLKTQYTGLDALNAEWETHFLKWEDVKPFTTDQIKARMAGDEGFPPGKPDWKALQQAKFDPAAASKQPSRWNMSPWCDHRTYMDVSLARILDDLRNAAHKLDPETPVGIEGTQMPSAFGGYDLWRLSQALDWAEPYDIGNSREILGSFMPGKPLLTTVGEQDAKDARRRLWHLLLQGDKGCIIWSSEDCIDWKKPDYPLTLRAKSLAPVLKEMQSPLANLVMRSQREYDPIAIHYSQTSIQVAWLLESAMDGSSWFRRYSSYEASNSRLARCRQAWMKMLQDLGYSPYFLSSTQIENGELKKARVFVLPDSVALSDGEWAEIRHHSPPHGSLQVIMGSGVAGVFDGHGKLRTSGGMGGQLHAIWSGLNPGSKTDGKTARPWNPENYLGRRLVTDSIDPEISKTLRKAVPPAVQIPAGACVLTHRYRLGAFRLLAFERNRVWASGEDLKQSAGNTGLENEIHFDAQIGDSAHAYDLHSGKYFGFLSSIPVTVDPWQPSLYALTRQKLSEGDLIPQLEKGAAP